MDVVLDQVKNEEPMKTFAVCKRFRVGLEHKSIRNGGFKTDNGNVWVRGKDKLWRCYKERETNDND